MKDFMHGNTDWDDLFLIENKVTGIVNYKVSCTLDQCN